MGSCNVTWLVLQPPGHMWEGPHPTGVGRQPLTQSLWEIQVLLNSLVNSHKGGQVIHLNVTSQEEEQ